MHSALTPLFALIRKDLILFLSNRRALMLSIVMPIVLGAFMGYVFGSSGKSNNSKIKIALVTQDTGEIGRKIAAGVKADATLEVQELPLEAAQDLVRKGKLALAVVLPPDFGETAGAAMFGARAKAQLPIYYDPSQGAVLAMVKGILTQHVMQNVSAEMFNGAAGQKMVDTILQQLDARAANGPGNADLRDFLGSLKKYQGSSAAQSAEGKAAGKGGGMTVPFATDDKEMTSGPKFNGFGHSFAGMSVQFVLMMSIEFGVGILLARRMGMWNRLLAAPISINTILMARLISGAIISFCVLCVIFAAAVLIFKVELSNPLGFAGVLACFALMTATFGLLIASFGKTPEASRSIAMFASLIMVMLGGAWIPSFLLPQWLQSFTMFVPTRWAIDGISAMTWRGLGIQAGLESMVVLLGFALLFGAIAFWRFRNDDGHTS
jgi:ABC-2 type transport system permease protein